MSARGPLTRCLLGLGLAVGGGLAVVGGLALQPPGLIAVGLAAVVSSCLAGGVARESRNEPRSVAEAAWGAGAATVAVLLVLSGAAALGGTPLTLLVAGSGVAAALAAWLLGTRRAPAAGLPAAPEPRTSASPLPPVSSLSTGELGREWVLSTMALSRRLDARTHAAIIARRQETLDELERRDPDGFARWLSGVPLAGSDPSGHLRHGDPAA